MFSIFDSQRNRDIHKVKTPREEGILTIENQMKVYYLITCILRVTALSLELMLMI
jgi:hypothetical protein